MSVLVDKKTYERYQAFPEENSGSLVRQYVSIQYRRARPILFMRGFAELRDRCPFLSVERLCGVQKEYGSELLSATCSTYPRALNRVENELEISLYLSCPQAARQVLLDADSTGGRGMLRRVTSEQISFHGWRQGMTPSINRFAIFGR